MAKKRKKKKMKIGPLALYVSLLFLVFLIIINIDKIADYAANFPPSKTKVEVKEIPRKITISDAIHHTKNLLGITENNYRTKIKSGIISISMGINPAKMDLNYANMILTGQIELLGGDIKVGKSTYNGNQQQIIIVDPTDSQKYKITLYYADSKDETKKTKIAIVVDDFGYHGDKLLDAFCNLNKNINFAILPDLKYSELVMKKAHQSGHETMIHIPMEPISYPKNNPGKNAIYVHLSDKIIRKRMNKFIKDFPLCVGANNHMGSLVTTDEHVMEIVLGVLKENNLYFVDSKTSSSSIAHQKAKEMLIPTFESNLFLDNIGDLSTKAMNNKISQIKTLAKTQDKIVVITHCTSWDKYEYLKKIIIELEKLNFELVPVSELLKNNLPEII